ncbi:MAG: TIGR02679 family protein [Planctomycetota bacterium]
MTSPPPDVDLARLRQALGVPALAWLVERLRARLEEGAGLGGRVTLGDPSPEQRAALDGLLGRRPSRGRTIGVDPSQLEQVLREGGLCRDLPEALEALGGPLVDRRSEREALERGWLELYARLEVGCADRPQLLAWIEGLRASGYLKRLSEGALARAESLVAGVLAVSARLPARGKRLPVLAAETLGDAHALDPDTPLGGLLLRAAAALGAASTEPEGAPSDARARREAWASVGVLLDELSAPALVLGLRAREDTFVGRQLALHAAAGEPCRLSVRQLLREPPRLDREVTGPLVFVCENPTVVAAAADRLGARCAPLVCTEGQPASAVRLLLDLLARAGIQLAYHGDFDPDGLRIAGLILRRHGAIPWRFRAQDYVTSAGGADLARETRRAARSPWDPALANALRLAGRAVPEERLLEDLLGDLAAETPGAGAAVRAVESSAALAAPASSAWSTRRFLDGLTCPRRSHGGRGSEARSDAAPHPWLARQRRELVALLRELHPGGVEVPAGDLERALHATDHALREGRAPLYGPVLRARGLVASLDALVPERRPAGSAREEAHGDVAVVWTAIRVTSATEVERRHTDALALAVWVAEGAGLEIGRALVAHVDRGAAPGSPGAPLSFVDRTLAARDRALALGWELEASRRVAALPAAPAVEVGPYCGRGTERPCPQLSSCWPYRGPTVFDLPRVAQALAWELHAQGRAALTDLESIPPELSERQRRAAQVLLDDTGRIDRDAIRSELDRWPRPLAYLDFETYSPAIPSYPGARPYEAIPFQFSCHVETAAGLERRDHLHLEQDDPRPALAAALVHTLGGHAGAVVVYNLPFESARLTELAAACPEHADRLLDLRARLRDLRPLLEEHALLPTLVRDGYSLKRVRAALLGEPRSPDLRDGLDAQARFAELLRAAPGSPQREAAAEDLRAYCARDTESLAELVAVFLTEDR